MIRPIQIFIAACCGALIAQSTIAADLASKEEVFYKMITIPIPEGIVLEAGAIQRLPGNKLAVSTRLGDIYTIEGAFEDSPSHVKFTQFATGLHEVLGLTIKEDWLYCTQRGEVTRMKDVDGDGRADIFETVNDDWGIDGNYHEYAFGSKFDREGNIWVTLCLTGSFTSDNPFRGWCLRVTPDGKAIPTCSGLRSPGGVATNALGDMFFTDNQGPWNGACALKQLTPGAFVGNPSGNKWYDRATVMGSRPPDPVSGSRMYVEAKKIPQLIPPAVLFPYNKMGQSASGIACDGSNGKFGPFKDQLFIGDQTHSTVMRVFLEKYQDRYQGVCFPFREGLASGTLSVEFGDDGSLFAGGTDRGWGARGGKPFSLQRLVWQHKVPFEIHEMHAKPDGFELTFTEPVDAASAGNPESYQIETYTYIYQSSYGSPEVDKTIPVIKSVSVAADGLSARLVLDRLAEGHVHELHLPGVRSKTGEPLLHPAAYYTLNYIPE
ncbi:MAG: hypothetical protein JWM99_495 [Verrucomicrobiales bacterium]|nr:hypothetical protein [Verrucomicrobiales bacterium]